jgi:hypothetical protein
MSEPQIIREGEKTYRLLQIGESTEETDEVKMRCAGWERLGGMHVGQIISDPVRDDAYPQGYYRREIK